MRVGVVGLGVWGFCLARHLSMKGYDIVGWSRDDALIQQLKAGEDHPFLHRSCRGMSIRLTTDIKEAITDVDFLVESVTTSGLRSVLEEAKANGYSPEKSPLILTSKGVEQVSHKTTPHIVQDIYGPNILPFVSLLSGPSFAQEVAEGLPTAVVSACPSFSMATAVSSLFSNSTFRVYPNEDITGVALGGSLKNVIAIACGIADGLNLGTGAKASLVTRGLHEMVKLASRLGCSIQTLYGLSGLGDLYLTCSSPLSRNFRFGRLLSEGLNRRDAEAHIGMVVEGAYTAISAYELAKEFQVEMPITQSVYELSQGVTTAKIAVERLMQRIVKEEKL